MPAVATAPKTSMAKPVKEKKKATSAKPSPPRSHPPYFQMIKEAILALRERTGSSSVAIAKHMEENHKGQLPANFKKMLATQLRNSAAKGKLVKVKASFKLSDESKKEAKPSKEKKVGAEKKKTLAKSVGVKRKADTKKGEKKVEKKAKKAVVVKKVAKSPAKAKKPKSIKSPKAKKAKVVKAKVTKA